MSASILMLIARIMLAVCLYGFLTAILFWLWRDLRPSHSGLPPGSSPQSLRWLRPDGTVQHVFSLEKDSYLIGRSPTIEIPLADETVSLVHARIWKSGNRWWLEDLDSRNGTFLNEIPVKKSAVLCLGDRIRLGRCVLEYHAEGSDLAILPSIPTSSSLDTNPSAEDGS